MQVAMSGSWAHYSNGCRGGLKMAEKPAINATLTTITSIAVPKVSRNRAEDVLWRTYGPIELEGNGHLFAEYE
jgi:hypothetical protein